MSVQTMTVADFHAALKSQGVQDRADLALICPCCGTVQSARDLISAGAGLDFEAVEKYLGFSCVGRWTGAGSPRATPDGQPCNWTLGGLFRLHKLEVVTEDGQRHPRFEVATPDQAQAHAAANAVKVGAA
ncbi:VVA0879 family protein [Paracoccus sp. NSM]|uniref:VVA0879 family protein n=1 Tax=Paracoccus sp. NSM TaxID=3457784 RepID=UPI0040359AC2